MPENEGKSGDSNFDSFHLVVIEMEIHSYLTCTCILLKILALLWFKCFNRVSLSLIPTCLPLMTNTYIWLSLLLFSCLLKFTPHDIWCEIRATNSSIIHMFTNVHIQTGSSNMQEVHVYFRHSQNICGYYKRNWKTRQWISANVIFIEYLFVWGGVVVCWFIHLTFNARLKVRIRARYLNVIWHLPLSTRVLLSGYPVECENHSLLSIVSVNKMAPGWNAPLGVENVQTFCVGKPTCKSPGRDNNLYYHL